ncbi:MAG: MOSC N-terminal beta barrel domain-containing protein [Methylococcales bacterium]|nr:MOSC N-terminal beta barrel domain-containing protein [Methylococcales bacterium]
MQLPRLSDIYIYPVKSLTGIRVEQWPVTANGLLYDRHWMLVDAQQQFLSQRRSPRMTLISTELTETQLIISAPGMDNLCLGLQEHSGEVLDVQIWHDLCKAQVVSEQADRWFSQFLDTDCRLVFQPENGIRSVDPRYANPNDQTSFSDGFPFLIIAENSLVALNAALPFPIGMVRFRPNLVIENCAAYEEDIWREISINGIHFRLPKPCARCPVPTIDLLTAEYGKEPLKTLSRLRKWENKVYFGQNALHDSVGTLHTQADVTVIQTGAHQPPL